MRRVLSVVIAVVSLVVGAGLGGKARGVGQVEPAQEAKSTNAPGTLRVAGRGLKAIELSMSDFRAMPRRTVTVKDKDGKPLVYDGVLAQHVLSKAGLDFGQGMLGPRLRDYLLAEASDGYAVVFALPELSAEFSDRAVLVADTCNDKPLTEKDGPFKIIVSDERKHSRWVRNLTSLTVHTCEKEQSAPGAATEK